MDTVSLGQSFFNSVYEHQTVPSCSDDKYPRVLLLTQNQDSRYLFSTLNFNGFVFIFINKSKTELFEISRQSALRKDTKVPKVQILTQNFKIRGDLGHSFRCWLPLWVRDRITWGACSTYGSPSWKVLLSSPNLQLKQNSGWSLSSSWNLLTKPLTYTWWTWVPGRLKNFPEVTYLDED